jgi:type II secretory pathway component PulC
MKRWLVVALVATASNAHADVKCHKVAANDQVDVVFKGDPAISSVITWLVGTTCKDVIVADPTILTTTVKLASGKRSQKQAETEAFAAIRAAGFKVETRDTVIIIKRGALACPGKVTTDGEVPPPIPVVADVPEKEVTEADLVAGIKVVSPTQREIKEATIEAVLVNPMRVTKGVRVDAAMKDGKSVGFKFLTIKADSVFRKLGFAAGDVVKTINGIELTSLDKGLELYTTVREAKRFDIVLERGGKPVTLVVTVVP